MKTGAGGNIPIENQKKKNRNFEFLPFSVMCLSRSFYFVSHADIEVISLSSTDARECFFPLSPFIRFRLFLRSVFLSLE